jgi:D-alanyl-D-alanine dipeptidase
MVLFHLFLYKVRKPLLKIACWGFVFIQLFSPAAAQNIGQNHYGLRVIQQPRELKKTIAANSSNAMQDVKERILGIVLDLKYCGTDNFMKQALYPETATTYLRKPAVMALAVVQKKLKEKGLGLKIWDAYRPYSVTEKMWEPIKDDRYAANPKFGSGHNRGVAVDLTIIQLLTKKEINMGTGFDDFSDTAHVNFKGLSADVLQNRWLLQSLMEENGFKILDTEWWHFYLPDAQQYELMNLSFKQLQKINKASSN